MNARPRILGVDDSLTIRKALEIILKPAGYELELATDGAEALAKAKTWRPELILLDFILPDVRGTDVCRLLASDPETAQIPVVLISARGAEIEQAYRDVRNVVSYIAKPFKPPVLTAVVAEALARAASGEPVKLPLSTEETHAFEPTAPVDPQPGLVPASTRIDEGAEAVEAVVAPGAPLQDLEEELLDGPPPDDSAPSALSRERIEWLFETLRSCLEGVYVEEVDTRGGAVADQAKSYTDLIAQLSQQLAEGLDHGRSGARYRLYGDGSIRSLDDALLDVFRRSCRALFRAAAVGVGVPEVAPRTERVLIACRRDGRVYEELQSVLQAHPEWSVVVVAERFRQLPFLVRVFGPSILVTEVSRSGALWDQLRIVQRLPEAQNVRIIGIADPPDIAGFEPSHGSGAADLHARGVSHILHSAFDLDAVLGGVAGQAESGGGRVEPAGELRMAV